MATHPNLSNFVISKIEQDLLNKKLIPHGHELWLFDDEKRKWFVYIESSGVFWYNQTFFRNYLDLFSIEKRDFDRILKNWFEKKIGIPIRQVMKRNSDMEWYIEGMSQKSDREWSLNNRNGFSYETVNRFLGIQKNKPTVILEDFIYL